MFLQHNISDTGLLFCKQFCLYISFTGSECVPNTASDNLFFKFRHPHLPRYNSRSKHRRVMSCLWEWSPLKWSRWNTTVQCLFLKGHAYLQKHRTVEGRVQTSFLGLPIPVKVKSAHTPQAFVRYGTPSLSFSSNYGHASPLPDLLTWRGMLIEMSGHFGQCVPPAGVARDVDGVVICLNFIFQLLFLSYVFTNGGLQQAVGGDGAVPEEPVEVGIHRKEHRLQNMSDHRLKGVSLISELPFNTLHSPVAYLQ